MNKQELIAKIVKDTGLTKVSATGAVESLLDGIKKSLKKGNAVTFVGFGSFQTSMRKARLARNPQTGATVKVPKRRVVRFKAGKALKDSVNYGGVRWPARGSIPGPALGSTAANSERPDPGARGCHAVCARTRPLRRAQTAGAR